MTANGMTRAHTSLQRKRSRQTESTRYQPTTHAHISEPSGRVSSVDARTIEARTSRRRAHGGAGAPAAPAAPEMRTTASSTRNVNWRVSRPLVHQTANVRLDARSASEPHIATRRLL